MRLWENVRSFPTLWVNEEAVLVLETVLVLLKVEEEVVFGLVSVRMGDDDDDDDDVLLFGNTCSRDMLDDEGDNDDDDDDATATAVEEEEEDEDKVSGRSLARMVSRG